MKFLFTILLLPFTLWGQTWTDPVNITPNLPGLDNQPDLCIDKNGILHCVFTHKLASNWRKIYYTKSIDDGATWTIPEDISLNPDTTLYSPHIVADTNNKLYVTYDYNVGSPSATLIYMKTYDGNQWSTPFVVSEGMYNSDHNKLCIDHNNRIYIFWGYLNHWTNYRYFENGQWSEIYSPYPDQGVLETMSIVVDTENNLHCVGWGVDNGAPYTIYFSYLFDNIWTEWTVLSSPTDLGADGGSDIALTNDDLPAISYRQKTYFTAPYNDSTMFTFFNGTSWSEPELVVNDPYEQKIAIDSYDRVHIIDREKLEIGTKLVHYQKINDLWQGYIVDEADNLTTFPDLTYANGQLYLVYNKSDIPEIADVYISKFDITTGISYDQRNKFVESISIYPNPFRNFTNIKFTTCKNQRIDITIYTLEGKFVKTIDNLEFQPGTYEYKWHGVDCNGKQVNPGLYIIRVVSGRKNSCQTYRVYKIELNNIL